MDSTTGLKYYIVCCILGSNIYNISLQFVSYYIIFLIIHTLIDLIITNAFMYGKLLSTKDA